VKVDLLYIMSDYRGLAGVVGSSIKQAPSYFACFRSWHRGIFVPNYKMRYQSHALHLPEGNWLRRMLLNIFKEEANLPEPRLRMKLEFLTQLQNPIQDVTRLTHPNLYPPHYTPDPRHFGQPWMLEQPHALALNAWTASSAGAVILNAELTDSCSSSSSSGVSTPEEGLPGFPGSGPPLPDSLLGITLAAAKDLFRQQEGMSAPGTPLQFRLSGWQWSKRQQYDGMHSITNSLADIVLKTITGKRWTDSPQICRAEHVLGRFTDCDVSKGPGQLSTEQLDTFKKALAAIARGLKGDGGSARLVHMLSSGRKPKAHDLLLLAGPIGCYALATVRAAFSRRPTIYATLQRLLQVCGLLWCKVQHCESLSRLRAILLQTVCMVACFLPISEMDIKLHELHEMSSAIENLGPLFTHAMFSAESLWGTFMRILTNRTHVTSNMMHSMVDREHISFYISQVLPFQNEFTEEELQMLNMHELGDVWGEEELLQSAQLHIDLQGSVKVVKLSVAQAQQRHILICREDGGYAQSWDRFVKFLCASDE